jgi:flagellar secretion chaperone FliS
MSTAPAPAALAAARRHYATEAVATASPARLLLMLWDRLVRDLVQAEDALVVQRLDVACDRLVHAQDILAELDSTLDVSVWEGGEGLSQLYRFCRGELVTANLAKDPGRVGAVRELLEPLRDAWREAALSAATPPVVAHG